MINTDQQTYYSAAREGNIKVIHHLIGTRLRPALYKTYLSSGLHERYDFNDSLEDFLLFLYDGPAYMQEAHLPPFSMMLRISNVNALYSWITSTYRLFLLQQHGRDGLAELPGMTLPETGHEGRDDAFGAICDSIAFCYCNNTPVGRFILIRWLLTVLERERAIAQEPIAAALGLKAVTYRVGTARQKQKLRETLRSRQSGKGATTDKSIGVMSRHLADEFDNLYECLAGYYDECIASLPQASEIQELRRLLSRGQEKLLHEKHLTPTR